ncbi:MAG: insulinase family protein [Bacteroidia bacterium]|nr:insulinase family protein [Bacteroidia bacterium]
MIIPDLDRTHPPIPASWHIEPVQQVSRYSLDNGIPVYYINAGFQNLVKVELIFPNLRFGKDFPLVGPAANRLMSDGTSKHNSRELAEAIDYYGAFLETEEGPDYCSLQLYTLTKHLNETLPYLREILTDPVYPENELDVYRQNHKQKLIIENNKVGSLCRRKFANMIFGNDHPYGFFVYPEDYDRLERGGLVSHHREKYTSGHCTIVVSGRISAEALRNLNAQLGGTDWTRSNGVTETNDTMHPSPGKKQFVPVDGAIQSAIRIGKIVFNRSHPDYPAMTILNTVLGGYFGSRLMSNLREDKGYTYGVGSAVASLRQAGYFFISTEVDAGSTLNALHEIYLEIDRLRNEEIQEPEVKMVKNYLLGTFLKGNDGAFHLAERFKSIHFSGLDYDYYDRYIHKLTTVTAGELKEMAIRYLEPSTLCEMVVGSK